jgi:hypothetical protein
MTVSEIRALVVTVGVLVLAGLGVLEGESVLTFLGGLAMRRPGAERAAAK